MTEPQACIKRPQRWKVRLGQLQLRVVASVRVSFGELLNLSKPQFLL